MEEREESWASLAINARMLALKTSPNPKTKESNKS